MWRIDGREHLEAWSRQTWDLIVIGGGITGAGILLEAARRGLKTLLIEQRDFAWGTSSRSSKLVHGGLRYLKEGRLMLTRSSVLERDALLRELPGLVDTQGFAFGDYAGRKPGRWMFALGLAIYDLLAGQRQRHYYDREAFLARVPHINQEGLRGGLCYADAKTDDARLVMRVLHEAIGYGAQAINYVAADSLIETHGRVEGVHARDQVSGASHPLRARLVINATGAWADRLRADLGRSPTLRPLRGSHLVFSAERLPVSEAVSLMHPSDGRPVFMYPWEGVTIVGTTDVDDGTDLNHEASISTSEFAYLMQAVSYQFPTLGLDERDVLATYAGVRPVIDTGKSDPSKEGRDHVVWNEQGLLTVTGGKLTTFRHIAIDALKKASGVLPELQGTFRQGRIFRTESLPDHHDRVDDATWQRLCGRHGKHAVELVALARDDELCVIPGTLTLWAELRWAARHEAIVVLDDLLLRRTRLGIQLRAGGAQHAARIRAICQSELGWHDEQWEQAWRRYIELCSKHYALPLSTRETSDLTGAPSKVLTDGEP